MHLEAKRIVVVLALSVFALAAAPAALAQAELFDGRPTFSEGAELGYYIWREGDTWHVRWTTKGVKRRFTGLVVAEGGELKSLKRIDVESESRIVYPGRAPRVAVGPRGRVYTRGGRPPVVATREQDKIEKDGDNKIRFLALTDYDIDGFNFKVDKKVTALRFALEIDGKTNPQLVEVGKNNRKAPNIPFTVSLK
jgi:hypothetical protein